MKFGVFDHVDNASRNTTDQFSERLALAEAYDRSGFYAYHIAEHHGTPLGLASSPLLFLAAVSQRTTRLRFGPLVLPLPLYNPLRLYEEICMLDRISNGRLELGVGRGISPYEQAFFGRDPQQANDCFKETLALLRQAFTSEVLNFHGEFHHFEDVPLVINPVQKPLPPLWYGVLKAETAEWAANQGMNVVCGHGPADDAGSAISRYRETHGNLVDPVNPEPVLGLMRQLVIAPTDSAALEIAERGFKVFRRSFTHLWELNQDPFAGKLLPDDFASLQISGEALAGSPETVGAVLKQQLEQSGANYLVCRFNFGDLQFDEMMQSLTLFCQEIMPVISKLNTNDVPVAAL